MSKDQLTYKVVGNSEVLFHTEIHVRSDKTNRVCK